MAGRAWGVRTAAAAVLTAAASALLHNYFTSTREKLKDERQELSQADPLVQNTQQQQQHQLPHHRDTLTAAAQQHMGQAAAHKPQEGSSGAEPSVGLQPQSWNSFESAFAAFDLSEKNTQKDADKSAALGQRCGDPGSHCLDTPLRAMFFALQREEEKAAARRAEENQYTDLKDLPICWRP